MTSKLYFGLYKTQQKNFFFQLNTSIICQECMDTVSKQFIFKQKIRKNIQMPSSNVIIQVSKFLSKTKDTICSSEHLDVLSIFPERRKQFVETVRMFSPEICMIPPTIKEVLPKSPIVSAPKKTPIIFKTDTSSIESDSESNQSNYYDDNNKSSRKRKKNSVKARNTKKHTNNTHDSIVSKQLKLRSF